MGREAAKMRPKAAADAIGNALRALCSTGPDGVFQAAHYREPDYYTAESGRPSALVRFDGVAKDDWNKYQTMPVPYQSPSDLRFAVRIYHVLYAPAEVATVEGFDQYQYAQDRVMEGYDDFYVAMRQNNDLGGLIEDIILTGSIAAPLRDARTNEDFFGMELILITTLY
jgi:hypothetical protein